MGAFRGRVYDKARNIQAVMTAHDTKKHYTVSSAMTGLEYASDGEWLILELSRVTIRLRLEDVPLFIEELTDMQQDIKERLKWRSLR